MGKKGFYFDMTTCIACHACQVACRDRNNLYNVGEIYRTVTTTESGKFPNVDYYNLSIACNHCSDPACVRNCPTGATHVADDGTVVRDNSLCIQCASCVNSCPYGAPKILADGSIGKCDSCKPLRDAGMKPVCVDACLMRALDFGDVDELKAKYGDDLVQTYGNLPDPKTTSPNVYMKVK